jgi:hypothetical protein
MQLTNLAGVIATIILALWLSQKFLRRGSPDQAVGTGSVCLLAVVMFGITWFFLLMSSWVGHTAYDLATKPTYTATVIGFEAREGMTDDHGNRGEPAYVPKVRFTDAQGKDVELLSSIATGGDPPVLGSTLTIVYAAGDEVALEKSVAALSLMVIACFGLFCAGFGLCAFVAYACGADMRRFKALFGKFVTWTFFLAIFGMAAALGYAVYEYFFMGNPKGLPAGIAGLCVFFELSLLSVCYILLRGIIAGAGTRADTK